MRQMRENENIIDLYIIGYKQKLSIYKNIIQCKKLQQ